jgi:hypothetical protein
MYENEVKKVMTRDVQVLFQSFEDKFKESTQKQVELIGKFSCVEIKQIDQEFLEEWKTKSVQILQIQEDILENFDKELQEFEGTLESDAKELIKKYKPMLEECDVEVTQKKLLDKVLDKPLQDYRQTDQYIAGKRAIMIIPSQISRNRFIMNRVTEFIDLIFTLKAENQVIPTLD